MSAVAVAAPPSEGVEELFERANRELALCDSFGKRSLEHAIRCGEALSSARALIPHGQVGDWLKSHFAGSDGTAYIYMRLAKHRDRILESGVQSIESARELLLGYSVREYRKKDDPTPRRSGERKGSRITSAEASEAREMRSEGLSYKKIGSVLGASHHAVMYACDASYRARKTEQTQRRRRIERAGRTAVTRTELQESAKSAGVSELWADMHRMGEQLDVLSRTGETSEIREVAAMNLKDLYRMRDRMGKVLVSA